MIQSYLQAGAWRQGEHENLCGSEKQHFHIAQIGNTKIFIKIIPTQFEKQNPHILHKEKALGCRQDCKRNLGRKRTGKEALFKFLAAVLMCRYAE